MKDIGGGDDVQLPSKICSKTSQAPPPSYNELMTDAYRTTGSVPLQSPSQRRANPESESKQEPPEEMEEEENVRIEDALSEDEEQSEFYIDEDDYEWYDEDDDVDVMEDEDLETVVLAGEGVVPSAKNVKISYPMKKTKSTVKMDRLQRFNKQSDEEAVKSPAYRLAAGPPRVCDRCRNAIEA